MLDSFTQDFANTASNYRAIDHVQDAIADVNLKIDNATIGQPDAIAFSPGLIEANVSVSTGGGDALRATITDLRPKQ